jgi:TusA-related sulfurtransferase
MRSGEVLEVLSDDEGIVEDLEVWCRRTGNRLLALTREGDVFRGLVQKG